nr:S-locus glycoprotein domain-containing protein [Tanacetum cinerariifolium]
GVVSQCSLLYVRSFITVKDVVVKFKDLQSDLKAASSTVTLVDGSVLTQRSSLHVEKEDYLVSPNRQFTAGFHRIGLNAYCFGIWFSEPMSDGSHTFVWMANRDEPVNGKRSKISMWKNGNVVLMDVNRRIWTTDTQSSSPLQLKLLDSGRFRDNSSRIAMLDSKGHFRSSDNFAFNTMDNGHSLQRRLTLDVDGNIRVYSLHKRRWKIDVFSYDHQNVVNESRLACSNSVIELKRKYDEESANGRSPISDHASDDNQSDEQMGLVSWVREKQTMDILDPMIRDETEKGLVTHLVKVALQCVEEDKDARPTMSEVVKMLLAHR